MSKLPKVIVFGASGFIGEHIIKYLAENSFDITDKFIASVVSIDHTAAQ